jgi:hypothetical protein
VSADDTPTQAGVVGPATHLGQPHPTPARTANQIVDGVGDAIDAIGGSFTMRYTTIAVTATSVLA